MHKDIRRAVKEWAEKVGRPEALSRLTKMGLSASTADKLCSGRYNAQPSEVYVGLILKAMSKEAS